MLVRFRGYSPGIDPEFHRGPGETITIPTGTHFQVRADDPAEPIAGVGVTMPPWPGDGEAEE